MTRIIRILRDDDGRYQLTAEGHALLRRALLASTKRLYDIPLPRKDGIDPDPENENG